MFDDSIIVNALRLVQLKKVRSTQLLRNNHYNDKRFPKMKVFQCSSFYPINRFSQSLFEIVSNDLGCTHLQPIIFWISTYIFFIATRAMYICNYGNWNSNWFWIINIGFLFMFVLSSVFQIQLANSYPCSFCWWLSYSNKNSKKIKTKVFNSKTNNYQHHLYSGFLSSFSCYCSKNVF